MNWEPGTYEAFADLRERPFLDLLCRIHHPQARRVVDAGCGTGRTTARLAAHFPRADVLGIDASPEMLARTAASSSAGGAARLHFVQADLQTWTPDAPTDVVVANAVLHWLPDPERVLRRLAGWVAPGGVLAIQVPANFGQPSHQLVHEAAARHPKLADVRAGDHVLEPDGYARVLEGEGFEVDAWETTYRMRLPPGGVLDWLKGTTLRPHLAALGDGAEPWLADLGARLDHAYPPDGQGVVFPFTRRFVVGRRRVSRSG